MKGEFVYHILKFIEDGVLFNLNFFEAVAISGYGASYKKLEFEERRIAKKRKSLVDFLFLSAEDKPKVKRKLSKLISKLKKDGLISVDESKNRWFLTVKGRAYFKKLREKLNNLFPRVNGYKKESGNVLKILVFDIPEKERAKRGWLCSVLKNLGFRILQKSVWIGKNKIPETFIKDLSRLGLLNYVEILEVVKRGSLAEVES